LTKTEVAVQVRPDTNFRMDLVGLRGVAVLAVLLHHFEIPGFIGAFYGPDIFFVLSGFLITGSLVREYGRSLKDGSSKGTISFIGLYLRRARRIIPAATFVILIINLYAHFFVNDLREKSIFLDSIWTFFFGANIRFLREATDYFSVDGVSPLVHFWSLSVTEQFYVVWPFLLLFAARVRIPGLSRKPDAWKMQMIVALSILIVISFTWSIYVFEQNVNQAYFSTFCRAWELAVGGAIAILTFKDVTGRNRSIVSVLRHTSLGLLFGSIFIVTPDNFGHTIFLPVIACAFLIFTGKHFATDLSSRVLGSRPLSSLGNISYSVYLWHWPVFVFAHNLGWMNTLANKFVGILVTLLLGFLTFRFIEQTFMRIPIPKDERFTAKDIPIRKRLLKQALIGLSLLLVFAVPANAFIKPKIMYRLNINEKPKYNSRTFNAEFNSEYGVRAKNVPLEDWQAEIRSSAKLSHLPSDLDSPLLMLDNRAQWKSHGFDCMDITERNAKDCQNGSAQSNQNANAPKVVIFGSSFASALVPAAAQAFNPRDYNIRGYGIPMCSLADVQNLKLDGSINTECSRYRPWAIAQINQLRPDFIFMSAYDRRVVKYSQSEFTTRLEKNLRLLKPSGAKLILFGTVPLTSNLKSCLIGKNRLGPECTTSAETNGARRQSQVEAIKRVGGTYIDPLPWICSDNVCPPTINNMIVSWDGYHLTTWFSKYIGRFLEIELRKADVIK